MVKLQKANEESGTREELVLKFFAYHNNAEQFQGAVTEFLNNYMEAEQEAFDVEAGRQLFTHVVDEVAKLTVGPLLRTNTSVTPQNELEAVLLGAARVLDSHDQLGKPPAGWLDDEELVEASTGATNTRAKLRRRIERAESLLTPS